MLQSIECCKVKFLQSTNGPFRNDVNQHGGGGGVSQKMILDDTGGVGGGQPKMTDDVDGVHSGFTIWFPHHPPQTVRALPDGR